MLQESERRYRAEWQQLRDIQARIIQRVEGRISHQSLVTVQGLNPAAPAFVPEEPSRLTNGIHLLEAVRRVPEDLQYIPSEQFQPTLDQLAYLWVGEEHEEGDRVKCVKRIILSHSVLGIAARIVS